MTGDESNDQSGEQPQLIDRKVNDMLERVQSLSWRIAAVESHSEFLRVSDKQRATDIQNLKAQIDGIEKRLQPPAV